MKSLRTLIAVGIGAVLGGYVLLFALHNAAKVEIDLILGRTPAPAWALVVVSFLAGVLVTAMFAGLFAMRRVRERRQTARRIAALEKEVHELRNAPLKEVLGPGEAETAGPVGPPRTE